MKPLQEPAAHVAAGLQGVGCLCGATGNKVVVVAQNGHPSAGGLHDVAPLGVWPGGSWLLHTAVSIPLLSVLCSLTTLQRTAMAVVPPRSKESKAE